MFIVFYDRLDSLCSERGITITELMKVLNLSPSSASRWRSKGYMPSKPSAKKIAEYFGVSVDELLGGKKESASAETKADNEMEEILQDFRDNPALRTLFSLSRSATPEELRQYADVIRALRGSQNE